MTSLAPLLDQVDGHVSQLLLTRLLPTVTTPHTRDPSPLCLTRWRDS